jgi:putative CocE/NonD family hydrolase
MSVPALNIGGWYDVFLRSTLGSYASMKAESATARSRSGQRLVIGPWVHGWNTRKAGEIDFGPNAVIDAEALQGEWFDHWLKDKPLLDIAPVRIFVMGDNEWRDESTWPLARAKATPFYFHQNGDLSRARPEMQEAFQRYHYDPTDPVPTLGGNIMRPELRGPYDQAPLDDRKDILRFISAPVTDRLEITGPITAALFVESTAVDTDFMAKLIVIKPDGRAFNLVDGVLRTRFREGYEAPKLMEPGKRYRLELDLWATSYALAPGDRLRVDVTSSNFPRLARNPNTGAAFAETTKLIPAEQTIHLSRDAASHIVLPIIPNE